MANEPKTATEALKAYRSAVAFNQDLDSGVQPSDIRKAAHHVVRLAHIEKISLETLVANEAERRQIGEDCAEYLKY